MNTSNKEIDIFELYQRTLSFLKRRWSLIIILTLLGVCFGFVKVKLGHNEYQGILVVSSNIIDKNDLYKKILPLVDDDDDDRPGNERFSGLLDVKPDMFNDITMFKIDTMSLKNGFIIKFQHKDSLMLTEIAKTFTSFYQSQPDFNKKFESKVETYRKYLQHIDEEISDLNNYQKKVLESSPSNAQFMMNLAGSSTEIIELYESKFKYEKAIESAEVVSVDNNSVYVVSTGNYLQSMLLWGFVFILLAFILALLLELDREAKKRFQ